MKGPCHKWIIIRCITKYNQFGTSKRILIGGQFRRIFYDFSHQSNGIHIKTGFRRTYIYRTANSFCTCQRLRNGTNQILICRGHFFGNQGGISPDKVHSYCFGSTVKGFGNFHKILRTLAGRTTNQRSRCNGNSLIYNGDSIFHADFFSYRHQIFCHGRNFMIDIIT